MEKFIQKVLLILTRWEISYRNFLNKFWNEGSHSSSDPECIQFSLVYRHNPCIVELIPITSMPHDEVMEKIKTKEWLPFYPEVRDLFLKKYKHYNADSLEKCTIINADLKEANEIIFKDEKTLTLKRAEKHQQDILFLIRSKMKLQESVLNQMYFARLII